MSHLADPIAAANGRNAVCGHADLLANGLFVDDDAKVLTSNCFKAAASPP